MIQQNISNKLPKNFIIYRMTSSIIFFIILIIILNFIFGHGAVNGTVNGKPSTIDLEGLNKLIVIYGIPSLLFILSLIVNILYYIRYSFTLSPNSIVVTSGIFFVSTSTVDFKNLQNISTHSGPLLMLFGLNIVKGFTSSPAQMMISSGGNNGGTSTSYRPDISIILAKDDAQQLRDFMAKADDIQKVQVVS